jgi:creatinine amidohydrolase
MKLWEMKWPEVAALDKTQVVVVPTGSLEQHGHHLPLFVDSLTATYFGEAVERALPAEVVLAPTVWTGSSHHHLKFAGTVSLRPETYIEVLFDIFSSLVDHGFRKLVLINGHGGNRTPADVALNRVRFRYNHLDPLYLVQCTYWTMAQAQASQLKEMATPGVTHACEYETSMILALRADLVDLARAKTTPCTLNSEFFDPYVGSASRVAVPLRFDERTHTGALGRPDLATAEKGRKLLEVFARECVKLVEEVHRWGPIQFRERAPV